MIELVKALPFGAILTYVVALLIGSQGSKGAQLEIFRTAVYHYDLWWSWPLFLAATGLAWGIMLIQR